MSSSAPQSGCHSSGRAHNAAGIRTPVVPLGLSLPAGARVLVYGLGKSGVATGQLLTRHGIAFDAYDDKPPTNPSALSSDLDWASIRILGPDHADQLDGRWPAAIVSPGVPPNAPSLARLRAAGVPLLGEIELAWRFCPAPVVAITGTNGKTTTATMAEQLLTGAGLRCRATGNIGYPFTRAVTADAVDWFVLEVSSFQLHHVDSFKPKAALITSFAANHLDWHGTEQSYFEDKMRIAARMSGDDVIIFPHRLDRVATHFADHPARRVTFGPGGLVTWDSSRSTVVVTENGTQRDWASLSDFRSRLPYDLRLVEEAFLACAALAWALDLPPSGLGPLLEGFRPLPHRIEVVGTSGGVTFVNDSKSTSVDATVFALGRLERPVVLLLGGKDKGLNFRELLPAARGRVKAVVAYGQAAGTIATQLADALPLHQVGPLDEALALARTLAVPGDAVLLSPACASYDQFKSYEHRGDVFRQLVSQLPA